MRTKEDIMKDREGINSNDRITLEVLIDIRDVLEKMRNKTFERS